MEKYLKVDYDMYENKYLTKEEEIQEYFERNGSEFIECGQGEYEDEAEVLCKVGEKYYKVNIYAEVLGHSMDIGEKLYQVESIKSVIYEEIPKPLPKEITMYKYELNLTEYQKQQLENTMKSLSIDF